MKKYIIIDAEKDEKNTVKGLINCSLFKYESAYQIVTYNKLNKDLIAEIKDVTEPKVYFININREKMDIGLKIAKLIRITDINCFMILLIPDFSYLPQIHKTIFNIYNLVDKSDPGYIDQLVTNIQTLSNYHFDTKCFSYRYRHTYYQIFLKSINYIYRDTVDRKLVIVTDTRNYILPMNLADVIDRLDNRFAQVHRSCIINKENVTQLNWTQGYFILKDGSKIFQVSKKYKKKYDEEPIPTYDSF